MTEHNDAACKILMSWIGYAWDGLPDGRLGAEYRPWHVPVVGGRSFQGHKDNVRDIVRKIVEIAARREPAPPVTADVAVAERDCFAEQAAMRDNRDEVMQEIMRINNDLLSALQPFAEYFDAVAEIWAPYGQPSDDKDTLSSLRGKRVTYGDLRRARAVIGSPK